MSLLSYIVPCTLLISSVSMLPASDPGQEGEPRVSITPRQGRVVAVRQPSATLRADVNVVLVPVTVTNELNQPVHDLSKERFRVLEDGVEQKITSFLWEDGP